MSIIARRSLRGSTSRHSSFVPSLPGCELAPRSIGAPVCPTLAAFSCGSPREEQRRATATGSCNARLGGSSSPPSPIGPAEFGRDFQGDGFDEVDIAFDGNSIRPVLGPRHHPDLLPGHDDVRVSRVGKMRATSSRKRVHSLSRRDRSEA